MMSVMRALLLSSQSKARFSIFEQPFLSLFPFEKYRIVASQMEKTEACGCTFNVEIYRPVYEEDKKATFPTPHKTRTFDGELTFVDYLRMHDLNPENGWYPVE